MQAFSAFDAEVQSLPRYIPPSKSNGGLWRMAPPVLNTEGRLVKGGMWPSQRRWWELPNFVKILVGGFGSGKSVTISKRAFGAAMTNAPAPVAIVSPTFKLARHTIVSTMQALLAGKRSLLGKEFRYTYNKTYHEFRIRYRGRRAMIIVYSGDDPDSLRGFNLGSAYIDEPFIQEKAVFEQMVARVRHPDARLKEIGLGGTPEQLNWGYDLAMGQNKEQQDVGVVQFSTTENLILDDQYVPRLEGVYDGKAAQAYIHGQFVNLAGGLVFYSFEPQEHVVDISMPPSATLGVGMDFNVNPMAATVFWRHGEHIHYIDEFELENADTEYMAAVLKEKYPLLYEVYPDASGNSRKTSAPEGKTDFWYLEKAGFEVHANAENPKRRDRFNAVNGKLKPKRGRTTITVSPSCRNLVRFAQEWSHPKMNKQKALSHLMDAFSYPIAYLFPVDREAVEGMVPVRT